jgi:glutaminase
VPAFAVVTTDDGRIVRLTGELGFAGIERIVTGLRQLATTLPPGEPVTVDARELGRTHPGALVALRMEFATMPEGFRLVE